MNGPASFQVAGEDAEMPETNGPPAGNPSDGTARLRLSTTFAPPKPPPLRGKDGLYEDDPTEDPPTQDTQTPSPPQEHAMPDLQPPIKQTPPSQPSQPNADRNGFGCWMASIIGILVLSMPIGFTVWNEDVRGVEAEETEPKDVAGTEAVSDDDLPISDTAVNSAPTQASEPSAPPAAVAKPVVPAPAPTAPPAVVKPVVPAPAAVAEPVANTATPIPVTLTVSAVGLKPACKAECSWNSTDPKDGYPRTINGKRSVACGDTVYTVSAWTKIPDGNQRFCFTVTGIDEDSAGP